MVFKYIGAQIAPLRIDVEQNTATRLVRLVAQLGDAWGDDADGTTTSATASQTSTAPAVAAAATVSTSSATSTPSHDGALLQLPPSTAAAALDREGHEGGMGEGGWDQVEGEWAEAEAEAEAEAPLMLYVREMHLESVVITATIYIAALCDEVRPCQRAIV